MEQLLKEIESLKKEIETLKASNEQQTILTEKYKKELLEKDGSIDKLLKEKTELRDLVMKSKPQDEVEVETQEQALSLDDVLNYMSGRTADEKGDING